MKKNQHALKNTAWFAALAAAALALAACGGGDSDRYYVDAPKDMTGSVAASALVSKAKVKALCADGKSYSATANEQGAFSMEPPVAAYPCLLEASGGNLAELLPGSSKLYSYAGATGKVNITPLTHLVVVQAYGQAAPSAYTPGLNLSGPVAGLQSALEEARYLAVNTNFGPFGASLSAGDAWQALHQNLLNTVAADASLGNFAALATEYVAGNTALPQALEPVPTPSPTPLPSPTANPA